MTESRISIIMLSLMLLFSVVVVAVPSTATSSDFAIEDTSIATTEDGIATLDLTVAEGSTTNISITELLYDERISIKDADNDGKISLKINIFKLYGGYDDVYETANGDRIINITRRSESTAPIIDYLTVTADSKAGQTATGYIDVQPTELDKPTLRVTRSYGSNTTLSALQVAPSVKQKVAYSNAAVVEFHTAPIQGRIKNGSFPGNNLIFVDSSQSGSLDKHVIQVEGNKTGYKFRNITVDYDNGDGQSPANLANASLKNIGIDASGDGAIDYSLYRHVTSASVPTPGKLQIQMGRSFVIDENDALFIEYSKIQSPSENVVDNVSVSLNGSGIEGHVEYGRSGTGELGNGVSLDFRTSSPKEVIEPLPHDLRIDRHNQSLFVAFSPRSWHAGTDSNVSVALSLLDKTNQVQSRQTVSLVSNSVSLSVTSTEVYDNKKRNLSIEGNTTLSPNEDLTMWVIQRQPTGPSLEIYPVSIGPQRQFSFTVPNVSSTPGSSVTIIPKSNYSVIDGRVTWKPD